MGIRVVVLGIETSCDETAAAIFQEGRLQSNIVASQLDIHRPYWGVVPELASRAHVQLILPTIHQALVEAAIKKEEIEGIAVTYGPGLIGSLLVGLSVAKAMALALDIPFVGINHIEGHIFANIIEEEPLHPPFLCLVVSGGHTQLVEVQEWGRYRTLGQTVDDAAGEAFDKVAKMLKIGYPGGPIIDKLAQEGDPEFVAFPRALMERGNFNFSFSGLKTAVLNYLAQQRPEFIREHLSDIAASFQAAVVDVLVAKTLEAARVLGMQQVAISGGVSANSWLRRRMQEEGTKQGLRVFIPKLAYCTDNAAMIARAGLFYLERGLTSSLELSAVPSLQL